MSRKVDMLLAEYNELRMQLERVGCDVPKYRRCSLAHRITSKILWLVCVGGLVLLCGEQMVDGDTAFYVKLQLLEIVVGFSFVGWMMIFFLAWRLLFADSSEEIMLPPSNCLAKMELRDGIDGAVLELARRVEMGDFSRAIEKAIESGDCN